MRSSTILERYGENITISVWYDKNRYKKYVYDNHNNLVKNLAFREKEFII